MLHAHLDKLKNLWAYLEEQGEDVMDFERRYQ